MVLVLGDDEIVFEEERGVRVLRGRISGEDEMFVHMEREDGNWSVRKALIIKIRRAR